MVAKMWQGLVFISTFVSVLSLPRNSRDVSPLDSCIGKSTKVIARAMLQSYAENEKNLVFSPLGYSSLLGMLAEGAHGETEKEMADILHLNRDNVKQRNEFRDILSSIKEKYSTNKPQLRSWFYVYKNYSVEESYKNILMEYYLTEIKKVYPAEFEVISKTKDIIAEEIKIEDIERDALAEDIGNSAYVEKQIIQQAEREDELFKTGAADDSLSYHSMELDDVHSAIEAAHADEKPLVVEVSTSNGHNPVIQDEAQSSQTAEELNEAEEVAEKLTKAKIHLLHDKTSLEIDPANLLPEALKKGRKAEHHKESLMIIFNGYFFEAKWAIPFDKNLTECTFHVNETEKVNASTIKTRGIFQAGEIAHLNSSAISIPFQGGRYSLVIILPNECDGLDQLVSNLNDSTLQQVLDMLEDRELQVQIPWFTLESTTDPEPALNEIGVRTLFSRDADLTSISHLGGLRAQEIVQLVTMKITENIGTTNFMTAASVASRSIKDKFIANHPFLFFIEDRMFNVTVVAGKIINPTVIPL